MFYPYTFYWDPTLWLLLPCILLSLFAQIQVSSSFQKYSRVPSRQGMSGERVAQSLLSQNGVYDVSVMATRGSLTDHFDPRKKIIRLSETVYDSDSLAAVAVAAHETGHAIQHATRYAPLKIREAIAPVVSFVSNLAFPLLLVGFILGYTQLVYGAAIAFGAVFVFQLITLPVEFNASRRALAALEQGGYLYQDELQGAKKVLRAAALTYVAATLTAFIQFLRLLLLARQRDR